MSRRSGQRLAIFVRADFLVSDEQALRRAALDEMARCGVSLDDAEGYVGTPIDALSQLVGHSTFSAWDLTSAGLDELGDVLTVAEISGKDPETEHDGEFPWEPLRGLMRPDEH